MNKYDILGIGSPIIDYILHVDERFVEQIVGKKGGMEPVDLDVLQRMIQESGASPMITTGGCCSNTIKGLANLGFQCALWGAIGQDAAAAQYLSSMKTLGVVPLFQSTELPTSQVLCLVTPDKDRTCRTYLGASQDVQHNLLTREMFQDVSLVHMEGYSLLQGDLPEKALSLAKEMGAKISFDLASFEVVEQHKERIMSLLSNYVDIAFANEQEIIALTGVGGEKGCQYLRDISQIAVVKQGKAGCWVGGYTFPFFQPGLIVKAVDTTGAGDLFASGFLGAYLQGKSFEMCAKAGNLLGASAVEVEGTDIPPEKWKEIKDLLHKNS